MTAATRPATSPRETSHQWQKTFMQDCDTNMHAQHIVVSCVDNGGGPFWVLETERWAFDSIAELLAVLARAGVTMTSPPDLAAHASEQPTEVTS